MATISHKKVRKAAIGSGVICLLANLITSSVLFWQVGSFNIRDFIVILALGSLFAIVIGGLGLVMSPFLANWPVFIAYAVAGVTGIVTVYLWLFSAGFWLFGGLTENLSIPTWQGWFSGSIAGMLSLVTFLTFFKKYPSPENRRTRARLFCFIVTVITVYLTSCASIYFFRGLIRP